MSLNKWFEEWSAAQIQHLVETPSETTTLLQTMEKRHLEFVENQDRILQESARESETVFQEFKDTLLHNFGVHYDKIDFDRLREENGVAHAISDFPKSFQTIQKEKIKENCSS